MKTSNLATSAIRRIGSHGALLRKARVGAVVLLALSLGSCVISNKPLIVGSKPILGEHFDAVLFRDFTEGSGSSQKVGYRWTDGDYVRRSAAGKYLVKFVTEPLPNDDLLVERTQDDRPEGQAKLFIYFIARKVARGAYLIAPLNENDLASADRDKICGKDHPAGFCAIRDHDQLMTLARATAGKSWRNTSIAVLTVGDELKAASVPVAGVAK